ncbi:MAG: hypothetical protein ACRDKG_07525 [Actinomycetota bacterium]
MAYVVRRPAGRWEIRESFSSKAGPRSRTLASFKVLTPQIVERAVAAAHRPVVADNILRAAKKAGAPVRAASETEELARSLLRALARGGYVRPGLGKLLVEELQRDPRRDDALNLWVGASLEDRAETLIDLMDLGDSLPKGRSSKPLGYPRLTEHGS